MNRVYFLCLVALGCTLSLGNPTVKASPDVIKSLEDITISWTDIPNPSNEDLIIIRAPVKDQYTDVASYFVNETEGWKSGSGSLTLKMLNMRRAYHIEYKSQDESFFSNTIRVHANYPMQGHLSLTGDLTEMRVMWVSNAVATPTVLWGTSKDSLIFNATGQTTTYEKEDLCWETEGGNISSLYYWSPGLIHTAVMTNLKPATTYYYQFGSHTPRVPLSEEWSEVFQFRSPQAQEKSTEISLIAFGDSGVADCEGVAGWCEPASGPTAQRIMEALDEHTYDLLLHIGDISYAVGYGIRWDQFFHQIQPIATRVPYHVCIGNHEYDHIGQPFSPSWGDYGSDSHGECGVPFNHRFIMPKSQGSQGNLWWSMENGPVHFTFISTEHNWTIGSPQYEWLEKDLASVDRQRTPWLVLSGHRPMYSGMIPSSTGVISEHMRKNLEGLLMKYSVDVALWGHVHNYERMCPVFDQECKGDLEKPGAPVHFVIGMAGMGISTEWADPEPEWSMFRAADYGYTRIHVTPTRFILQFWNNRDGRMHDEAVIHKKAGFDFQGFEYN